MPAQRIHHEPAYVLHHHDWSESSLILDVFTRHHGRVALVAKGAKKPSSNFRPVLLPLQPLQIAFGGDAEIRTLKGAEWMGGHTMPSGDALMSGYYLNELLIRLLARDDPHPRLFDTYAATVQLLATDFARSTAELNQVTPAAASEGLPLALRSFELLLLRDIGLLPTLHVESASLSAVDPGTDYVLVPEGGLRTAHADDRTSLSGAAWLALQAALGHDGPPNAVLLGVLRACAPVLSPLRSQLRTLLHYHCGVPVLRTRQIMMELQNL
jgi:DNA repair protein RecO (recombination protein O)